MILLILAAGLAVLPRTMTVGAQSSPLLSVQPPSSEVRLDSTTTVLLYVTSGVDVNAFDVAFTYDAQKLSLQAWAHGGYLSNVAVVYLENQPGRFRLAATQLGRPGVSGDGTLLTFVFLGVASGLADISITHASFSSPTGVSTAPLTQDGSLTVSALTATPSGTPTITSTFTATPTAIPTITPTLTPTPTTIVSTTETPRATLTEQPTFTLPPGTRTPVLRVTALMAQINTSRPTLDPASTGVGVAAATIETPTRSAVENAGAPAVDDPPISPQNQLYLGIFTVHQIEKFLETVLLILILLILWMLILLFRHKAGKQSQGKKQ